MNENRYRLMLCAGLLIGGLLGVLAWQDWKIALGISSKDIGFGPLGIQGADHNEPVRFSTYSDGARYVFETANKPHGSGMYWSTGRDEKVVDEARKKPWKRVWVPLVHDREDWAIILLLLRSDVLKGPADIERLCESQKVTGILTLASRSLSAEEQKNLRTYFPGINIASLWILEHNQTKLGTTGRLMATAGAVVCLIVSAVSAARLVRARRQKG